MPSIKYDPSVQAARQKLRALLDHWRDGTRPGDDSISSFDVALAVEELAAATTAATFGGAMEKATEAINNANNLIVTALMKGRSS